MCATGEAAPLLDAKEHDDVALADADVVDAGGNAAVVVMDIGVGEGGAGVGVDEA